MTHLLDMQAFLLTMNLLFFFMANSAVQCFKIVVPMQPGWNMFKGIKDLWK